MGLGTVSQEQAVRPLIVQREEPARGSLFIRRLGSPL